MRRRKRHAETATETARRPAHQASAVPSGTPPGWGTHAGQVEPLGGDPLLELFCRALRDQAARVQDRDPVGEPVGFLQVLRGEEDGHARGGQARDDLPHGQPARRIEAGRRLVKEDHRRTADQAGGEIKPAAHPARVGAHAPSAGRGQFELLEQLGRALPGRRPGQPR